MENARKRVRVSDIHPIARLGMHVSAFSESVYGKVTTRLIIRADILLISTVLILGRAPIPLELLAGLVVAHIPFIITMSAYSLSVRKMSNGQFTVRYSPQERSFWWSNKYPFYLIVVALLLPYSATLLETQVTTFAPAQAELLPYVVGTTNILHHYLLIIAFGLIPLFVAATVIEYILGGLLFYQIYRPVEQPEPEPDIN